MRRILAAFLASMTLTSSALAISVTSSGPTTPGAWSGLDLTVAGTLNTAGGAWLLAPSERQGSVENKYRSPFDGSYSAAPSGWDKIWYYAVGPTNPVNPAELRFDTDRKQFSFLWGSLDTWNQVQFFKDDLPVYTLLSDAVGGSVNGVGAAYVTVSDLLFDKITFLSSPNEALEFSNMSSVAAVPLPAGLPLLAAGLGVLGYAGWRKKRGTESRVAI